MFVRLVAMTRDFIIVSVENLEQRVAVVWRVMKTGIVDQSGLCLQINVICV